MSKKILIYIEDRESLIEQHSSEFKKCFGDTNKEVSFKGILVCNDTISVKDKDGMVNYTEVLDSVENIIKKSVEDFDKIVVLVDVDFSHASKTNEATNRGKELIKELQNKNISGKVFYFLTSAFPYAGENENFIPRMTKVNNEGDLEDGYSDWIDVGILGEIKEDEECSKMNLREYIKNAKNIKQTYLATVFSKLF